MKSVANPWQTRFARGPTLRMLCALIGTVMAVCTGAQPEPVPAGGRLPTRVRMEDGRLYIPKRGWMRLAPSAGMPSASR